MSELTYLIVSGSADNQGRMARGFLLHAICGDENNAREWFKAVSRQDASRVVALLVWSVRHGLLCLSNTCDGYSNLLSKVCTSDNGPESLLKALWQQGLATVVVSSIPEYAVLHQFEDLEVR